MNRPAAREPEPQQARDVVAFGQEFGRVLSDGRIVGRAEPFAKVFPSSRAVKRAVGVTAWAILEDIALDAQLDVEGRLVAETNVRRIAANLGLAKNTVAKHLGRLREHGFVLHEEGRDREAGRFETARYVLDPTAALERFTVTPAADGSVAGSEPHRAHPRPCRKECDTAEVAGPSGCDMAPCPGSCDTGQIGSSAGGSPPSQSAGHRMVGRNRKTVAADQQLQSHRQSDAQARPSVEVEELARRLKDVGVDDRTADELLSAHPAELVREALDAVGGVDARKPAGWVVAAIRGGWDVSELAAEQRRLVNRQLRSDIRTANADDQREVEEQRLRRIDAWFTAAVEALDTDQLDTAVSELTQPVAVLGRRVLAEARAHLARWAAANHLARPEAPLPDALTAALEDVQAFDRDGAPHELPPEPGECQGLRVKDADRRLGQALERVDARNRPDLQEAPR